MFPKKVYLERVIAVATRVPYAHFDIVDEIMVPFNEHHSDQLAFDYGDSLNSVRYTTRLQIYFFLILSRCYRPRSQQPSIDRSQHTGNVFTYACIIIGNRVRVRVSPAIHHRYGGTKICMWYAPYPIYSRNWFIARDAHWAGCWHENVHNIQKMHCLLYTFFPRPRLGSFYAATAMVAAPTWNTCIILSYITIL